MGGGGGLSKIGTALTVIFVVSLVVLLAELYFFLWRRRVFHGKTNTAGGVVGEDALAHYSSSDTALSSSKQLLYFFCLRRNSRRLDRSSITPTNDLDSKRQTDMEVTDMDMLKIQSAFGPPRFLFTIKEEEEEEEEAEDLDSPVEQKEGKKIEHNNKERLNLEPAAVVVEIDDTTPFSTPCASPVYFTPSASPAHEAVNVWSRDEGRICSE